MGKVADALSEVLERAVLQKRSEDDRVAADPGGQDSSAVINVLSLLAKELHKLHSNSQALSSPATPRSATAVTSPLSAVSGTRNTPEHGHPDASVSRKRRRLNSSGRPHADLSLPLHGHEDVVASLPPADMLEEAISIYFTVIHPWIPMLHDSQFRHRLRDPDDFARLLVILHAMVVAALRFVDVDRSSLSLHEVDRQVDKSRKIVLLNAMDQLSVENLQALIIIAFNDVRSIPFLVLSAG